MPDEIIAEVLTEDVVLGSAVAARTVKLDAYVKLLAEERECASMLEWWTRRQRDVKKKLADIMGTGTVGTVNGETVMHYAPQDRFNSTEFSKRYPDMYRAYSRPVTETRFDADWFKAAHPDLYREFQVRPMRVTYKEPGA